MDYLRAVFKHTYFVVAGAVGVIWTATGFVLPEVEPSVPIGLALLGGSVVAAQFLAWRDMRTERDKQRKEAAQLRAQLEVRAKRKAIRETVGEFLTQGEEIKTWLEQAGQMVRKDLDVSTGHHRIVAPAETFKSSLRGSVARATEWEEQVYSYLIEHVGGSYAKRFRSRSETAERRPRPDLSPKRHLPAWEKVDRGLQVLNDILKEAGQDLIGT